MAKYLETKDGSLESVLEAMTPDLKEYVKSNGIKKRVKEGDGRRKENVQQETNKNDKSDDGEGLDAVQPKAVKKKFKDRKTFKKVFCQTPK